MGASHGRNWDDNIPVPNGFNINGDWTKFPNIGQAAWLFRSGAIQTGAQPVEIAVPEELRLQAGREKRNGNISSFLAEILGYDPATPFVHPVRIRRPEDLLPMKSCAAQVSRAAAAAPFDSDTGELTYDRDRRLFLIHPAQAAGVIGFLGTDRVTSGAIDVELGSSARGFASILVTSLDGQPVGDSSRLLLTTPGETLRSQPGVDPPRAQALVNYPGTTDWWTLEPDPSFPSKPSGDLNGGIRPVWMERVESYVSLRTSAMRLTVYPLAGDGTRLTALADSDVEPLPDGFRIHLQGDGQSFSPWYELVAER